MQISARPAGAPKSILVVDDDRNICMVLRAILEECGHQVFEAANGNAAYEHVRQRQPDLVITDLLMPEAEGIETIRRLIALAPDLKIIAMSGSSEYTNLRMAVFLGAARALRKPFSCEAVARMVGELLGSPDFSRKTSDSVR